MMCLLIPLLIFELMLPGSAHAQAGDRGGGDEIAAEVFHLTREVAKKIQTWVQDHTLQLSPEQVSKILAIVDLKDDNKDTVKTKTALLEVIRFEHVYKHPESPEPDETTLINIYNHSPPRIEVGSVRWEQLKGKPIEKEMMVLHELLGAAGIIKANQRIDDQFKISYELKLKNLSQWMQFKEELKFKIFPISLLTKRAIEPDLSHFKTEADLLENLPQYKKLQHPEMYIKGSKKKVEDFRLQQYNEIREWVHISSAPLAANTNRHNHQNDIDLLQQANQLDQWLTQWPTEWSNWALTIVQPYLKSTVQIRETIKTNFKKTFYFVPFSVNINLILFSIAVLKNF